MQEKTVETDSGPSGIQHVNHPGVSLLFFTVSSSFFLAVISDFLFFLFLGEPYLADSTDSRRGFCVSIASAFGFALMTPNYTGCQNTHAPGFSEPSEGWFSLPAATLYRNFKAEDPKHDSSFRMIPIRFDDEGLESMFYLQLPRFESRFNVIKLCRGIA